MRYFAAVQALNLAFAIEKPVRVLTEIGRSRTRIGAHARERVKLRELILAGEAERHPFREQRRKRPHVR